MLFHVVDLNNTNTGNTTDSGPGDAGHSDAVLAVRYSPQRHGDTEKTHVFGMSLVLRALRVSVVQIVVHRLARLDAELELGHAVDFEVLDSESGACRRPAPRFASFCLGGCQVQSSITSFSSTHTRMPSSETV